MTTKNIPPASKNLRKLAEGLGEVGFAGKQKLSSFYGVLSKESANALEKIITERRKRPSFSLK